MERKLEIMQAKAHKPRLVLSHHVHKTVHGDSALGRFNTWVAVKVTKSVGSMWCAYVFALIALISLPSAISVGQLDYHHWLDCSDFLAVSIAAHHYCRPKCPGGSERFAG